MQKLSKRQLKKKAYQFIVRENRSHQEVFDELRETKSVGPDALAEIVAKIPSRVKMEETKILRVIYIVLMAIVILTRTLILIGYTAVMQLDLLLLLFAVIATLLVPAFGIYAVLSGRFGTIYATSFLMALSIFRGLTKFQFSADTVDYLFLLPVVGAIVLGFVIPFRWKMAYEKKLEEKVVDGQLVKSFTYVFAKSSKSYLQREDIIDL